MKFRCTHPPTPGGMKEGAKCIFNFAVYALHCRRPPLSHNFRTASFAVKTRGRLKLACLVFLFFNMYYGNILDCLNILICFPKIINLGIWEPAFLQARLTRNNSTDASLAPGGSRSRSGVALFLGDHLLYWKSQRQALVAWSATEAEVEATAIG